MIWLVRHALSVQARDDASRVLSDEGRAQAQTLSLALEKLAAPVERCVCSPKLRAQQTARTLCDPLGVDVELEPGLAADFDPYEFVIGSENALFVGHEPSMSRAVWTLTGARVQMQEASLAIIDTPQLVALISQAQLANFLGR
jgi:phosphohistidine phosphatase SixA